MVTTRQKYKNLLRNPVASLFLLDPANPPSTTASTSRCSTSQDHSE